jgi:hypothetical protein
MTAGSSALPEGGFVMKHRTTTKTRRRPSITGRDGYIIAQALAYAIEAIAMLPEERQEASNREDMLAILTRGCGHADHFRSNAYAHLTGVGHLARKEAA